MIIYTTPTLELIVEGLDISKEKLYVTFTQDNKQLTFTDVTASYDEETGDTTIFVEFSQEETAAFREAKRIEVQVNWITANGKRDATRIGTINAYKNLLSEVINDG